MVLPTTGTLSISHINQAVRFTNGNVGINTTAPGYLLDINGTANATNIISTSTSTGSLSATNSTITNVVATNVSTGSLNASTIVASHTSTGSLSATNSTITNVVATNVSTGSLNASTIVASHTSTGTLVASTIRGDVFTGSSLQISGSTSTGTLVASTIVLGNTGVQNTTGNININFKLKDVSGTTSATTSNLQFYQNSTLIESSNINTGGLFHNAGRSVHYGSDITIKSGDVIDIGNNGDGTVDLYGGNVIIQAGIGNSSSRSGGSGSIFARGYNGKISFKVGEGILSSGSLVTTEVMAILAGGNVGIGTSTPSYKLDVNGAGRFSSLLATTSISSASLNATNSTITNVVATNVSTGSLNVSTIVVSAVTTASLLATTSISSGSLSATNVIGSVISAGTLICTTITGANISLSGNLIIGGTLTSVNITTNNLTDTNISAGLLNASSITTGSLLATTSISSASVNATNSTITNVVATAISTANLTSTGLEIISVTPGVTIRTVGGQYGKVHFGNSSHGVGRGADIGTLSDANDVLLWTGGTGSVGFATNLTERMRITSAGNVGIGTNNPGSTLDVNGTGRFTGTLNVSGNISSASTISGNVFTGSSLQISGSTSTGTLVATNVIGSVISAGTLVCTTITGANISLSGNLIIGGRLTATNNSNTVGNIFTTAGNVGIGTTSPSGMLHLNNVALFTSTGNLTCTGDVVSFGSLSDRRLKKNIQTIETLNALDVVSKLRAVKFDWRDDIFNEQKRNTSDIGFIAQEIEEIIPEAVSEYTQIESGEVYKNIKHERIIPYLLTAIQYLLQEREI